MRSSSGNLLRHSHSKHVSSANSLNDLSAINKPSSQQLPSTETPPTTAAQIRYHVPFGISASSKNALTATTTNAFKPKHNSLLESQPQQRNSISNNNNNSSISNLTSSTMINVPNSTSNQQKTMNQPNTSSSKITQNQKDLQQQYYYSNSTAVSSSVMSKKPSRKESVASIDPGVSIMDDKEKDGNNNLVKQQQQQPQIAIQSSSSPQPPPQLQSKLYAQMYEQTKLSKSALHSRLSIPNPSIDSTKQGSSNNKQHDIHLSKISQISKQQSSSHFDSTKLHKSVYAQLKTQSTYQSPSKQSLQQIHSLSEASPTNHTKALLLLTQNGSNSQPDLLNINNAASSSTSVPSSTKHVSTKQQSQQINPFHKSSQSVQIFGTHSFSQFPSRSPSNPRPMTSAAAAAVVAHATKHNQIDISSQNTTYLNMNKKPSLVLSSSFDAQKQNMMTTSAPSTTQMNQEGAIQSELVPTVVSAANKVTSPTTINSTKKTILTELKRSWKLIHERMTGGNGNCDMAQLEKGCISLREYDTQLEDVASFLLGTLKSYEKRTGELKKKVTIQNTDIVQLQKEVTNLRAVKSDSAVLVENARLEGLVKEMNGAIAVFREREIQIRELIVEFNKKGLIQIDSKGDAFIVENHHQKFDKKSQSTSAAMFPPQNNNNNRGNDISNLNKRQEYRYCRQNINTLLRNQHGSHSPDADADDSMVNDSQESSFGFIGKMTLRERLGDVFDEGHASTLVEKSKSQTKDDDALMRSSSKKITDQLRSKLRLDMKSVEETQKLIQQQQDLLDKQQEQKQKKQSGDNTQSSSPVKKNSLSNENMSNGAMKVKMVKEQQQVSPSKFNLQQKTQQMVLGMVKE